MDENGTIVAVATPPGRGALAVIRISGRHAFTAAGECLAERNVFDQAPPRFSRLYHVKSPADRSLLDQVTAVKYAAPRSFTGEDMVEITCHGGPRLVREIVEALLGAGARGAARGEFTRRALLNGKLDLLRAEAIRGIIESESEAALACSRKLFTVAGHRFREWRETLLDISARVEARIEFEDDLDRQAILDERQKIECFFTLLSTDIRKKEKIKFLEKGPVLIIAGPVNAGKSSLFNLLVGFGRSIVHSEPGTTRDMVSETVRIGEHEVKLVDSAGIRESRHEVEREGIGRAREAIGEAAGVLWVTAADENLTAGEIAETGTVGNKILLCIVNKIDRAGGEEKEKAFEGAGFDTISVSMTEKINCEGMLSLLKEKVSELYDKVEIPDLLFNERQEEIGRELCGEIGQALGEWERPEIAAHFLKRAVSCLDEFFGTANPEEVMNRVFENFCIGK
jgi:tRNA modification GTPase